MEGGFSPKALDQVTSGSTVLEISVTCMLTRYQVKLYGIMEGGCMDNGIVVFSISAHECAPHLPYLVELPVHPIIILNRNLFKEHKNNTRSHKKVVYT